MVNPDKAILFRQNTDWEKFIELNRKFLQNHFSELRKTESVTVEDNRLEIKED